MSNEEKKSHLATNPQKYITVIYEIIPFFSKRGIRLGKSQTQKKTAGKLEFHDE